MKCSVVGTCDRFVNLRRSLMSCCVQSTESERPVDCHPDPKEGHASAGTGDGTKSGASSPLDLGVEGRFSGAI